MLSAPTNSSPDLPKRITVQSIVSTRYKNGLRPLNWDERVSGFDIIVGNDGKNYKLQSDGGQSPPKVGWILLLKSGDSDSGFIWTLYGITGETSH